MKKFTWLIFSLFFAVCGWADNIKMVSYFPIPYASYSDLKVTDTCDVGLMNECILDVQNLKVEKTTEAVPNNDLNTGALFFIDGDISLNYTGTSAPSQILSENLIVGDVYQTQSRANLNVGKDLVIDGSFLTNGQTITSLYGKETTIKGLNLKGYNDTWLSFPQCDATDNEISWANLKINGVEGIYLTCGAGICETFYGGQSWPSSTAKTDTCTGADGINQFSCSSAPKGSVLSCTDAWRVEQPAPSNQNPTASPVSRGTAGIPDTCDGDVVKKYTGALTKDCDDVYADWRGSDLGIASSSCHLNESDLMKSTPEDCAGDPYEFYQQYEALAHDEEAFCEYIVTNVNPNGCFAEFKIRPDGYGCERPQVDGEYNYMYGVGCVPYFMKRTFKGPTYQYYSRSVRCCGDE